MVTVTFSAALSGVCQGFVITHFLFLVIANDIPDGRQLFCRSFADDIKMQG